MISTGCILVAYDFDDRKQKLWNAFLNRSRLINSKYIVIDNGLKEKINIDTIKIFELLGCRGYGRVDYIVDNNNDHYFLELNTLPGMTSTSLLPIAAENSGLSFNNLIKKIVQLGLK